MSNVFFTSDLHLGHGREFMVKFRADRAGVELQDVEEMNLFTIDTLNKDLTKRDHVYILGDVAFNQDALKWLHLLKGTKTLVLGNHDKLPSASYLKHFTKLHGLLCKYEMVFSHCPLIQSELLFRNWCLNVHGHIHHVERQPTDPCYFNVNFDVAHRAVPLDELRDARKGAEVYLDELTSTHK